MSTDNLVDWEDNLVDWEYYIEEPPICKTITVKCIFIQGCYIPVPQFYELEDFYELNE